MRYCSFKGRIPSRSALLAVVVLVAGCADGATTSPVADVPSFLDEASPRPVAQFEAALARYQRDMTAGNLDALRRTKPAYANYLRAEHDRESKRSSILGGTLAKAAVDEGWPGGTTEWTYAWAGNAAVPDPGVGFYTQDVPGSGTLLDVDVEITELRHTWVQDLIIRLLSPGGATSELTYANPQAWDAEGLTNHPDPVLDFLGTYFDDEASVNVSAWDDGALSPFTGSFQPYGPYNFNTGVHSPPTYPLSLADGQDMAGAWSLRIEDYAGGDAGTLVAWRLVLTIGGGALPGASVGTPYDAAPNGIGSDGSYVWSVGSGSLPAGLALNPTTGHITGTPTATGTSSFTIQGVGGPSTATASMSLTVNPALVPVPVALPDGTVGEAYPATPLTATGGGGGYVWSSAELPAGMTLSGAGVLGGVPTASGTTTFQVDVSSADGQSASMNLTLTVLDEPLVITTGSPILAVAGSAFSQTLEAAGGGGGYTWSITAGVLPDGLTLGGAVVSGTPQAEETRTVTVSVSSSNGSIATADLTFQVTDPNDPVAIVTSQYLPVGTRAQTYSTSLVASGADHAYTWSLVSGVLPGGLGLSPTGTISGTPTLAGLYTFVVEVEAGYGSPVQGTFTLEVVNPVVAVTTSSLPVGTWGVAYAATLTATGGDGTYAWSVVAGALPTGVTLSPTGALSGTPGEPGSFSFTLQVTSGAGAYVRTAQTAFTVAVTYPPLVITTNALPSGGTGDAYAPTQLQATGGNNVYAWSVTAGTLPAGLTLADGLISGTPATAGFYEFTVTAESGISGFVQIASKELSISVVLQVPEVAADCANGAYAQFRFNTEAQCVRFVESGMDSREGEYPELILVDTSVPDGVTGNPYGFTFTATGGADNLDSYREWTSSVLPAWLSLDLSTGTLSGTPLIAGTYAIDVTVTSFDDLQEASLATPLTVAWGTQPSPNVCAGGVWADYGFNSEAQCRRFVDTGLDSREGEFPDPEVTTASLPSGRPGQAYSATLTAAGGNDDAGSSYQWAVSGLPSWLTVDVGTGVLSGTPTVDGTFALTVTVTSVNADAGYNVTSAPVTLSLLVTTDPETRDDCKNGGWAQYGFKNQGQCIAFVNTGHDSRDDDDGPEEAEGQDGDDDELHGDPGRGRDGNGHRDRRGRGGGQGL